MSEQQQGTEGPVVADPLVCRFCGAPAEAERHPSIRRGIEEHGGRVGWNCHYCHHWQDDPKGGQSYAYCICQTCGFKHTRGNGG